MAGSTRSEACARERGAAPRSADALDFASRLLLRAITRLPRGAPRLINAWARRDRRLHDHPAPLRAWPERCLRLDLRTLDGPQLLIHGCYPYQVAEDELSARVLRPGDVVYDVGANIGYMTLMFLGSVGPTGRVHSFEPSRRCFAFLERNVEPGDPVLLMHEAVGAEPGEVVFEEHDALFLSSVVGYGTPESQGRAPSSRYRVEVARLDDHWRQHGETPQFVKVDVEGFESQVFQGMRELLSAHAPILLFEAASAVELERNLAAIRAARPAGYRFGRIAHDATLVPLDRSQGATNNYFAVPDWAEPRFEGIALPPA